MEELKLNHRYLVMDEEGTIMEWKVVEISELAYKIQDNTDYGDDQGFSVDWVLKEALMAQDDVEFIEDLGAELPFYGGGITYTPYVTHYDGTGTPPSEWVDNTTSGCGGKCGGNCSCKEN